MLRHAPGPRARSRRAACRRRACSRGRAPTHTASTTMAARFTAAFSGLASHSGRPSGRDATQVLAIGLLRPVPVEAVGAQPEPFDAACDRVRPPAGAEHRAGRSSPPCRSAARCRPRGRARAGLPSTVNSAFGPTPTSSTAPAANRSPVAARDEQVLALLAGQLGVGVRVGQTHLTHARARRRPLEHGHDQQPGPDLARRITGVGVRGHGSALLRFDGEERSVVRGHIVRRPSAATHREGWSHR